MTRLRFIIAGATLFAIHAPAVLSQQQSDSIKYHLEPITITATRITEPWLEVPLAITVVSMKEKSPGRGYGLDEILAGVPGVFAQSRYGNQDIRLTIRGYGARGAGARSNSGTSRGIRVLVDGFPETEPDGRTSFDLIDIAGAGTVEVVRSNASSVWGNASGGVINILSNTGDQPFVETQSSFGGFGFHKESVRANANVGNGRFFFSLSNTNFDGWRYHSGSTQSLLNTGVVSPLGERTNMGVYISATSNLFHIPGPLTQAQYDSLPQQADRSFIVRNERRFNRLGRLGVTLTHALNDANEFSASAFVSPKYLQRSERNRFRDFTRYHVGGNATYRNTMTFSDDRRNILLAGIDEAYQDGAILFYDLVNGDRGTTLATNKREGANNIGAFLQDEFMFADDVSISAGLRYDNISYYYDDYITPQLNDGKSFSRVTPNAGITYRLSPTQSIYANLGGGIEVPAGNETDPAPTFGQDTVRAINPLLEPITSTTFEMGTKQILTLGGAERVGVLTYDAALYWIEVRNDIIPYSGGAFYFSAGKTRRMGVELGARLHMENGLSIALAVTGSRNKYIEYQIDSVHYGKPGSIRDLRNNTMPGVPELYYSAALEYTPPPVSPAFLRVSVQGAGRYFADDGNEYEVPSYAVINAAAGIDRLAIPGTALVVSALLGVNNCADARYVASAWINPDLVNGLPSYLEPGLPRNLVVSAMLGWKF
jgi:iron complex outermembrane receptor protein